MSEGIVIALITTIGSLLGGIIGQAIVANATIKAAHIKGSPNQISDINSDKPLSLSGILGGALIGAVLTLGILAIFGVLNFGENNSPAKLVNETDSSDVLYDDFNDKAYDGKYNLEKWIIDWGDGTIFQQDGVLVAQVNSGEDGISLSAIKYQNVRIESPMFFEAKLMIKEPISGHVFLYLGLNSSPGIFSDCTLGYGDVVALLDCGYVVNEVTEYRQDDILVNFTTWHTVRIEVEPSTMTLTYYIDGQKIHSFIPKNSEQLKSERFNLQIGIVSDERNSLTGYIDDIIVGQIR